RVLIYDVAEARSSLVQTLTLKNAAKRVAWSPDGRLLACGDESGAVTIWDLTHGEDLARGEQIRRDRLQHRVWSDDGKTLFSADKQGYAMAWQLHSPGRWEAVDVLERGPMPLAWVVFSKDGKWVL